MIFIEEDQMTVGDLIDALAMLPDDMPVWLDDGISGMVPMKLANYFPEDEEVVLSPENMSV